MAFLYNFIGKFLLSFYDISGDIGLSIIMLAALFQLLLYVLSHKFYTAIKTTEAINPIIDDIRKKHKSKLDLIKKEITSLAIRVKYPLLGPINLYLIQIIFITGLVGAFKNPSLYLSAAVPMHSVISNDVSISILELMLKGNIDLFELSMYLILPIIAMLLTYYHDRIMKIHTVIDVNTIYMIIFIAVALSTLILPQIFSIYWIAFELINLIHIAMVKKFARVPIIDRKK